MGKHNDHFIGEWFDERDWRDDNQCARDAIAYEAFARTSPTNRKVPVFKLAIIYTPLTERIALEQAIEAHAAGAEDV